MEYKLLDSILTKTGKLFGVVNKKTWKDSAGTDRLIENTTASTASGKVGKEQVLATPNHTPEGAVLTDEELLAIPLHMTTGGVVDARNIFNGDQLAAAIRTRRDTEALVLAKANERGMLVPVPASKLDLYTKLRTAIERELDKEA